MRRWVLGWVGLLVVLVAGGWSDARGDAQGRELAVVVRGETLGLRVRDVPLPEVLAAVTRATGAALQGQMPPPTGVTLAFDPVPLREALRRLLGDRSFTLRYGAGGRLVAVDLRGGPVSPARPPGVRPASLQVTELLATAQAHAPVAVDGKLAALFGANRLTFAQLADAALRDSDADVRAQAMAAGLRAIEEDPALDHALAASLDGAGDGAAGDALRAVAGARAEELMAYVAARATGAKVRTRAARVWSGLRGRVGPDDG